MKQLFFSLLVAMLMSFPIAARASECAPDKAQFGLSLEFLPESDLTSKNWSLYSGMSLRMPEPVLQQILARLKTQGGDVELQRLSHDTDSQRLQILVRQWFVWDTLQLQLDFPSKNHARLRVRDNWIPSDLVLSRIERGLKRAAESFPIHIERQNDSIDLSLNPGFIHYAGFNFELVKPYFMGRSLPDGGLLLEHVKSGPSMADRFRDNWKTRGNFLTVLCGEPDTGLEGILDTKIYLALGKESLHALSVGSEKLINRLQGVQGGLGLKGNIQLSLDPFGIQASGQMGLLLNSLEIEQQTYEHVSSVPFKWRYGYPYDFEIYPELPPLKPVSPRLSNNQLTLFTDGPAYFAEIKTQIAAARESVAQEVFSFHHGETTHALARLLTLKALGLKDNDNDIVADPMTPDGIRVYLLHNHHLTIKGTREVQDYFTQVSDEIFTELATKGQDTSLYATRLRQQLRITPLNHGVAWADHRKLLIIDGRIAYVGGRNLGDSYLLADSFHDQMIRVEGPAVADLRTAYATNWDRLNPGQPSVLWSKAPLSNTPPALSELPHLSQTAVLTTSHRGWEIAAALVQSINEAKEVIRIEHAYLYHEPIEAALRAAKARGVEIRLLFSERSDESVFERLNPGNALKLMNAPGPGKVRCWLWRGPGGKDDYMVHTKFLSVDGKIAIAGSANLIPRSLQSPFTADGQPLLFNEELVLYIADPHFVATLDEQLFETDVRRSREAGPADLEALLEARGGALDQLIERLKGLMS